MTTSAFPVKENTEGYGIDSLTAAIFIQHFSMVYTLMDKRNDIKSFRPQAAGKWFHWKRLDIIFQGIISMVYKSVDHGKISFA